MIFSANFHTVVQRRIQSVAEITRFFGIVNFVLNLTDD